MVNKVKLDYIQFNYLFFTFDEKMPLNNQIKVLYNYRKYDFTVIKEKDIIDHITGTITK